MIFKLMQFSGFSEDQRVGCNGNFLKFTYVFQDLFLFTCISIKPNGSTSSLKRSIKPLKQASCNPFTCKITCRCWIRYRTTSQTESRCHIVKYCIYTHSVNLIQKFIAIFLQQTLVCLVKLSPLDGVHFFIIFHKAQINEL